jgi:hypothetical protein
VNRHDHEPVVLPVDEEPVATRVRLAFADQVSATSLDAVIGRARVRTRTRRYLAVASAGVVAILAAAALTLWPSRPTPSYAYANPEPVTPELRAAAVKLCGRAPTGIPPAAARGWKLPPVAIVDHRGGLAFVLFSEGRAGARYTTTCFLTRNKAVPAGGSWHGWRSLGASSDLGPTRLDPLTAALKVDGGMAARELDGFAYAGAYGRVTGTVRKVVVVRQDGARITATIVNGSFAAFWPTFDQAQTVIALDADGHVLHTSQLLLPPRLLERPVQRTP